MQPLKRIQLFEFEDFDWFPTAFRVSMTNLINVFHRMRGTEIYVHQKLADIRKMDPFNSIVDIGSGSGGVMPGVVQALNEASPDAPVKLLLTDLHPNPSFVKRINGLNNPHLAYAEESLDATNLTDTPEGLKTMMNSFHHMPPDKARGIMQSAQYNMQPLFI